ncbi:hypothetical protein MHLP_00840 [Candidatus Mycoplasma haematolamae str. Purdue]|uniref:Uncharacterized protein n=1 Tax=Mycoplasma haematolamae (strain Purdue) TaxID=1212765 RepID=I7BIU4_MYCHA|nr:hypothetical protein [Candidatus Mycoplasma haematolamae]AFO51748.1 hypothetical protein MHLP_00840 [Candidatus Mycoplasma haematolamae str. Purdue]
MIAKVVALKVGLPLLATGGLTGGSYYVVGNYVLEKTKDIGESSSEAKGFEYKFSLKNQTGTTLSLICLDEHKESEEKHNLQFLLTDPNTAEISCTSSQNDQSAKLTLMKKQAVSDKETKEERLVEVGEDSEPISRLECSSFDDAKNFECHLGTQALEVTKESIGEKGQEKLVIKIQQPS